MKTIIFLILALLLAGCAPGGQCGCFQNAQPRPQPDPKPTASPHPTLTAALYRVVSTGYPAGAVYIRSGPGMDYPVIGVAAEGELLYLFNPPTPEGWAHVLTFSEVEGYFYSVRWCKYKE